MDSFKLNKMETKTITIMENVFENNKLIADFMGIPFDGKYYLAVTTHLKLDERNYSRTAQDLKFRTSWNWIMPVVEKIDQILPDDNLVSITYNRCLIEYFQEGITIEGLGNTRIEATYKAVVEFIKWYNKTK